MEYLDACLDPKKWDCTSLRENWKKNQCTQKLRHVRLLASKGGKKGMHYSRTALKPYSDQWKTFANRYFKKYDLTDDVHSDHYCSIQETIADVCKNSYTAPLCSDYLDEACKPYTRGNVVMRRVLSDLCGCRVPPDKTFLKFTKKANCDPMCNRVGVAQRVDMNTGIEDSCNANICVINDVTLKLYSTDVEGGVLLNQICGHCGKDGCTCIVSGTSISNVLSKSKLPVVFSQFCSGNSVCIQRDPSGGPDKVSDCTDALDRARKEAAKHKIGTLEYYLIFISILVVTMSVLIVAYCRLTR